MKREMGNFQKDPIELLEIKHTHTHTHIKLANESMRQPKY